MTLPSNILQIIQHALNAFKPPERISVTECAEKYRVLPASNREGGFYRSSRTPFAVRIMDAFDNPEVEEIDIMGSAQWAKTTIMENIIFKIMKQGLGSILLVGPTLEFLRRFSKTRLDYMIEDSPELKKVVSKKKSRDSDNTILSKSYYGGNLMMVGANSPGGLRGYTAPYIFGDDIDAVDIGSTKEGDFMDRAKRAAETFEGMRKYIRASTPGSHGASRIYNYYLLGSQERWEVPCPACGKFQLLEIDQLIWEYDKDAFGNKILGSDIPETARIGCKHCGYLIDEGTRQEIILKGKWVALRPEKINHLSFYFNRFTSPFSSLKDICQNYIEAQTDPEKMQVFTNLFLGLPYKAETIEEIDTFELMQRVEPYLDPAKPYQIPNQVLFLVLSCDVQKNRLQVNVWGVGMYFEMWILNRYKFVGDPKLAEGLPGSPWNELKKLLNNRWKRRDGVDMGILIAGIDSSYLSDEVYNFTRGYEFTRRWWAIKGAKNPFAEIIPAKFTTTGEKRNKYLSLGVNFEKQSLFSRLKILKPENFKDGDGIPKYIHFDESLCDPQYFEEVTSERGNKKKYGNMEYVLYEKKKWGEPNEEWDLLVYASILAKSIAPDWEKLKINIDKKIKTENNYEETLESVSNPPQTQIKNNIKPRKINSISNW